MFFMIEYAMTLLSWYLVIYVNWIGIYYLVTKLIVKEWKILR